MKAVSDGTCKLAGVMIERDDYKHRAEKAEKSLRTYRYIDEGGELWKPPLGKRPDFETIDDLRNRIKVAESGAAALVRAVKKHKPNDGRFACFTCSIDYRTGVCRKCGSSCKHWEFDFERFGGGVE